MISERITLAPRVAVDAKNALGECVLWCGRTQRLFWTDIHGAMLWLYEPASGRTRQWPLPERAGSFALTEDRNRLLLGLESRLAFFNIETGALATICLVEPELPTTRINDGRCDRAGRFVFGTLNEAPDRAPIGSFYRLNHDLVIERLPLQSIAVANSICFSLDGGTMYYCDSLDKTIRACDYDPHSGRIGNQRVFAALGDDEGEPDGSIIDADGFLWNAQWGGGRVARYAPDGSVERVIDLPVSQPTCAAFGGAALDTLYVASARSGLDADALLQQPAAGSMFSVAVPGVRGMPEVRFRTAAA